MTWRSAIMAAALVLCVGEAALANAPAQSARPQARPEAVDTRPQFAVFNTTAAGLKQVIRPRARPTSQTSVDVHSEQVVRVVAGTGMQRSLRPQIRPTSLQSVSTKTQPKRTTRTTRQGSVCGVKGIKGQEIKRVRGRIKGCGVAKPVRITSVDGVALTQAATMDCTTAKALNSWVKKGVKPAVGRLGGGVKSLKVVAHYSCRTRNNQPGAKISEHGKGRAIDIAAINLNNGAKLSVLKGWRNRAQGKLLKSMHASACGPFGTVLGPNADRFHQDHFHLDTARYRGGSYCR